MPKDKSIKQTWTDVTKVWETEKADKQNAYMRYYTPFVMVMEKEEWFPLKPEMRIIEPGCGTGIFSVIIAQQWGAKTVCLDFVPEVVRLAKKKFREAKLEGDFIVGDMNHLPFKDNSFNMSFNQGTIEHFPRSERQRVLDEMARVSKRYVSIFVPNRLNPFRAVGKWAQKALGKWIWGLEMPYSPGELKWRLDKAGAKVTVTAGVNFWKIFYAFWPIRPIVYPILLRLMGDRLFRINAGNGFLNRVFGDEIYALGVKETRS